jgi:hypothetical protein
MLFRGALLITIVTVAFAACAPKETYVAPVTQPSASPGTLSITPSSLAFTDVGSSYAQTVTLSQPNYSGTFTASTTTCSGIATIAKNGASGFTVTPVSAGSCTFTITGGDGASATLSIGVTTTGVGGQ